MQAEPVAWIFTFKEHTQKLVSLIHPNHHYKNFIELTPLYAAPQAVPAVCEWKRDSDFEMGDTYHSSCGELWSFVDGGPTDNRVRYCHHCGKKVRLAAAPKE
jgi:hypothetical protein